MTITAGLGEIHTTTTVIMIVAGVPTGIHLVGIGNQIIGKA